MNRTLVSVATAVVLLAALIGFYLFWFAGGSGEPTTELTTPELADTATTTTPGDPSPTLEPDDTTTAAAWSELSFEIDPEQSAARFEIDEVLRGEPTHVIGTTDQVVGQVKVDLEDLSTAEFSEIIVNARTFTTGARQRDRAIRGPIILDSGSDANELITLAVTAVDGLEGAAEAGQSYDFTLTGDLTIKGNTRPVTFDVTVTHVDDTSIEGSATAEIRRDMFEIGIPSVASVADVTNEVLIALDFVAVAT